MGFPQVSSCCCFGLEQGTKLIGFIHLIVASVLMILASYLAADAKQQIGTIDDLQGIYSKVYVLLCVAVASSIVHIVLATVLLVGAYRHKTHLLKAWVWLMVFLYVTAIIYIIVVTLVHGISQNGNEIVLSFLIGLALFLCLGYAIVCVNSFYLLLRSDEDMCGPYE